MTIITTIRYQGNALTDTFNANRVQCLTLLVHTSRLQTVNTTVSAKFINKSLKHTNYKNKFVFIVCVFLTLIRDKQ